MARILRQLFLHAHRETTRYFEIQQPQSYFCGSLQQSACPAEPPVLRYARERRSLFASERKRARVLSFKGEIKHIDGERLTLEAGVTEGLFKPLLSPWCVARALGDAGKSGGRQKTGECSGASSASCCPGDSPTPRH